MVVFGHFKANLVECKVPVHVHVVELGDIVPVHVHVVELGDIALCLKQCIVVHFDNDGQE